MTDTRTRLLAELQRIEDDDYQLRPGERPADLVPALLAHIGDPAPELRDEIVYPTFHARRAVLDALRGLLHNGTTIFADEDDERMAMVVDTLMADGGLPETELTDWLSGLADCADQPRSRAQAVARVNTKNLLRSLDFRRPRAGLLAAAILAAEARVNRFRAA